MYKLFSKVGIGPTRVDVCGYKNAGSDDFEEVVNYVPPGSSVTEKRKVTIRSGVNPANMLPGPPITRPGLSRSKPVASLQTERVGAGALAAKKPSVQAVAAQGMSEAKPEKQNSVPQESTSASAFAFIGGEQSAGAVDTSKSGFGFMTES
jgi:hypothetical protein